MIESQNFPQTLAIKREDPAQWDIEVLLRNGEAEAANLYPAESNHHLSLDALRLPNVRFLVARDMGGKAVGTGAIVLMDGWAEIKRMWVEEEARGRGIARKILDALLAESRTAGVRTVRLETGVASHAALALYNRAGFQRREPFASYEHDPNSVFMEKTL